jgi:hypothetical protein
VISRWMLKAAIAVTLPCAAGAQAKLVQFTGTVVDSAKRPLTNADVAIEGMNLTRRTDDRGQFRFEAVSAGVHRVTVRKIGYAQLDTSLAFPEDRDIEWRVTMREKVVTLDSVIVRAPTDPLLEEFEENRKRGFGRFRTRADLTKFDGVSLPNVMRSMQGADIIRTTGSGAYMTSKRGPISGCGPPNPKRMENYQKAREEQERVDDCLRRERIYYVPDDGELRQGIMRACYPLVFVDRQLMTPGRPTPPFDIGSYATEQIEAIEWYESESQTPPKYSVNNARCGVMVLHIRKKK